MQHSENSQSLQVAASSSFVASGPVLRKEKKKQSKEDRDRQKQIEKKRRRLEKALATSAAIRLELEKKKQRKREEEQRLDEESAALAEAVALYVLLDEDREGVTHLGTYTEIDFRRLSMLSRSTDNRAETVIGMPHVSSYGHFDSAISPGFRCHSSFAYAFINGSGSNESLQSFRPKDEFVYSLNQSNQRADRSTYEGSRECVENSRELRVQMCQGKVSNSSVIVDPSSKSMTMHTVVDKKIYSIDAGQNLLGALVIESLD
ncbi:hypothetical protein KP509_03G096800 [Ceratopteris richardii]|uniref:Uncharacterized protein n=1 Tax=Ceratopteris richardii TaxID=49495 RepID=A0A8T2V5Y6_CERRI|nr:hypothetical protein KP509_03G096800 [Ceratopteris richardii]KAH7442621.1 hypothetical protein KP509_03G096800 [Ceratopteris richardii]